MSLRKNGTHSYNGLYNDLKTFAQFVFIYEKKIKHLSLEKDFSVLISPHAFTLFNREIKKNVRFATTKELQEVQPYSTYTLFFNSDGKAQIYNFSRHLRNSLCHATFYTEFSNGWIPDVNKGRETSKGYLEYRKIKDFLVAIIKDYESNNI